MTTTSVNVSGNALANAPSNTPMVQSTGAGASAPAPVPRTHEGRLRALRALELRGKGKGLTEIARDLGCSVTHAGHLCQQALTWIDERYHSSNATARRLEDMRLDMILEPHLERAVEGDVDSANLCIRLSKRRAELHALDLPVEQIVTVRRESEWQGQLESLRSHYPEAYAFLMRQAFAAVEGPDAEPLELTVIPSQKVIPLGSVAPSLPLSSNDYNEKNIGDPAKPSETPGITKAPPCVHCGGTGQAPVVRFGKDGKVVKRRGRQAKPKDSSLEAGAGI